MVFTIVVTQSQKEATFKNVHVLSGFNSQWNCLQSFTVIVWL